MIREPTYHSTTLSDLRPTQITIGMREVEAKRSRWREKHGKKAGEFLASHMIPVVLGPEKRRYVTDHHHLARALHEEGVMHVATAVVLDLSRLKPDSFWFVLDNRGLMHPFDQNGERRHYREIPDTIGELVDDPTARWRANCAVSAALPRTRPRSANFSGPISCATALTAIGSTSISSVRSTTP